MTTANKLANWATTNLASHLAQKGFDVILNIGQSNNVNGSGLDATVDYPMDVIKQLGRFDGYDYMIIPGVEPLHHHTRTTGKKGYALDFAREYVRHNNLFGSREVCIVPSAWGGTSFTGNRWNPGDDLCQDAIDRVNHVLNNYEGSRLVAILWHQGESDNGQTQAWYSERLDNMIAYMRSTIKGDNSKVPFITGGQVPWWLDNQGGAGAQLIENALIDTPNRVAYTAFADPRNPYVLSKANDATDALHYDATQQREFGKRYYVAYEQALLNHGEKDIPAAPQGLSVTERD